MKTLPLYPEPLSVPLTSGERLDPTPSCQLCPRNTTAGSVCMPAVQIDGDSSAGTLLIIDEAPDREADRSARPFISGRGSAVVKLAKVWKGNVVLEYATKCKPPEYSDKAKKEGEDKVAAEACSPYMRSTFAEATPDRVIIMGHKAARAVLGRYIPSLDTRKAYSWVTTDAGKRVPVFTVLDPDQAAGNKFLQKFLKEDFEWACTVDLGTLFQPITDEVFHIIENADDARAAEAHLRLQEWVAYDCETAGKMWSDFFSVVSVALTPEDSDTAYVWGREALADPEALKILQDLLADDGIGKVGANLKYDALCSDAAWGVKMRGAVLDIQLTRHLELPGCLMSLEVLSEMLGMGGYKQDFEPMVKSACKAIVSARKKAAKGKQLELLQEDTVLVAAVAHPDEDTKAYAYGMVQSPDLERYNARDTVATRRGALSHFGFELVTKHAPSRNIWNGVTRHMTDAYTQVESWGVPVSRDAINQFNVYITDKVRQSAQKFDKIGINLGSPKQVSGYLFDNLKLRNPRVKNSKDPKARSTDAAALKAMINQHPIIADILEHRRLLKLQEGYGGLAGFIREDGRIHPDFRIDGTETGRCSLAKPSLHTIPREEDGAGNSEGRMIKKCFAAQPGWRIVALDQSQIEYRVAAAESQDPVMRSMFLSGDDFHMNTARLIAPLFWKIRPGDVQKAHRSEAKGFSFGLLYGMGDKTIAENLNIDKLRAAELRATIMGKWTNLAAWIEEQIAYAMRTGTTCSTWNGKTARIRNIYQIGNIVEAGGFLSPLQRKAMAARNTAKNGSFNTPIQGKASDFVQSAVGKVVPWLLRSNFPAQLILTVHDSLVFHVREDYEERLITHVRGIMTDYDLWGVPMVADAESGPSWGEMKKAG